MKKVVFADLGGMIPFESDPFAGEADASYFYDLPSPEVFVERCQGAEAIVWSWINLTHDMLDAMPDLKMICYLGIGPQTQIDMKYAWSKGITFATPPLRRRGRCRARDCPDAGPRTAGGQSRQVDAGEQVGAVRWFRHPGSDHGNTGVGWLGVGVGSHRERAGDECYLHYQEPFGRAGQGHNVEFVGLDELMSRSDYIQLAPVLNDDTMGIIGERELGLMKEGAYLVNVSRGQVVLQDAVIKALESGQLAGFATDVYAEEPATDEPLRHFDNVVITPHIAYDTPAAKINMINIAANTIRAYLNGSPINVLRPD